MAFDDSSTPYKSHAPRLSIVTVCKDNPEALRLTLNSVASQTHQPFQAVVVDGSVCSDSCSRYLSTMNYRWLKVHSGPDNGVYDAMNRGLDLAEGDWVYYLNSGDRLHDVRVLEAIAHHLRPTTDAVAGKVIVHTRAGESRAFRPHPAAGYLHHQGLIYRRSIHDYEGRYVSSAGLTCADYLFFQRLITADWRVTVVEETLAICDGSGLSSRSRHFYAKTAIDFAFGRITRLTLVARVALYPIYRFASRICRSIAQIQKR